MKIAVIGHTGMVGRCVYSWFCGRGDDVVGYSLDAPEWDWRARDLVFVCVPTPDGPAIVREVLGKIEAGTEVVIKSTVPPGTCDALAKEFHRLRIVHNPEFLSRATAWYDFCNPWRQVLGIVGASGDAQHLVDMLPKAAETIICSRREAELLKYIHNTYGALMVIYGAMVQEAVTSLGLVGDDVRQHAASEWLCAETIERYWQPRADGRAGFGGPCFPKDMRAFSAWCSEHLVGAELIDAALAANARLGGEHEG